MQKNECLIYIESKAFDTVQDLQRTNSVTVTVNNLLQM